MTEKIKDFVEHELKMLDKGIVATPTEDYLENFSKAMLLIIEQLGLKQNIYIYMVSQ